MADKKYVYDGPYEEYKDPENLNGLVRVSYKNGDKFEGIFEMGEPVEGKMIYKDGDEFNGTLQRSGYYYGEHAYDFLYRDYEERHLYKEMDYIDYLNSSRQLSYEDDDIDMHEHDDTRHDPQRGKFRHGEPKNGIMKYKDGSTYEGDFEYSHPLSNGGGTFTYPNGNTFEGEFNTYNEPTKGELTYPNGDIFNGELYIAEGKPFYGTMTYKNDGTFISCTGHFNGDGKPYDGKIIYKNGNVFTSTYKKSDAGYSTSGLENGKPVYGTLEYSSDNPLFNTFKGDFDEHGEPSFGKMTYRDDSVYEGQLYSGKPSKGKMTYKDGSVYEGQFYSGKPSKGKMTYPNGDVFIGELRDDKPYKGKMTYKDGTIPEGVVKDGNIYKIEYKNGKPFQGEITYLNGNKYIGYFDENGKPNNGKMILPNGNIYKSNFIGNFIDDNGNPNYNCGGEFTVTYADYGDVYEGYCGPDGKPSDSEEEGRLRYKNGDEFYGEFKKGEPYEGSLTYRDRSCFDGIFKDGEPYNGKIEDNKGKTVWKGTWESGYTRDGKKIDVGIFEGEYRDNKPYEGKVTYSNGDFFEGKCRYGRAYEGVMTSKDKDNNIHENKLEGGKLSREGKIKYANGNIFEGSFNDEGKPSYGKMTYHNGNVYKGDFNYNGEPKCHRGDKLILPNGDTYTSRKDDDTFTINDRGEPCDGEYSISYGDYTSFRGKVVNGKPSHGKLDKKDGTTFIGDFVNGKPSSTGKMEYSVNNKNGFKEFEGSFVNDIPSHGKMTYWEHCLDDVLNGNIFEGDFVNGKPYNGTMIYEDGAPFGNAGYTFDDFNDVYVICQNGASFKGIVDENGKRSKGKMTYVDGTSFDGEFKDNIPYKGIRVIGNTIFDGTFKKVKENDYCYQIRSLEDRDKGYEGGERFQGTLTYGDKSVYEGSFENDKPSFGKITYPNGNIFEGTCRDYEPYKGKMTYTNGNVYEGNFHDGEISDGIMTCRDGTIFESGEISDGGDPIEGKMLYTNGDAFRGKFKNGKPSIGVKVLNNGDMLDGFWEDDRPVDVAVKVKLSDDGKSYCSFEAGEKSSYQKNVVEYHLGDRAEVTINYDGFNRILNGDAPEINSLNDLVSRKIISGVKDFNELKELSKKVFQDKMSRGTEDVHRGNHGSLSNLLLLSSIDTVDQFKGAKFIEPMQDNREVKAVSLTVDEMKAKIEALEIPRSKRLPEPKPGRYPGFFMGPVARKEQKSDLHRKIQAARKNKDETFASREEKRKNEKKDISGVGHK